MIYVTILTSIVSCQDAVLLGGLALGLSLVGLTKVKARKSVLFTTGSLYLLEYYIGLIRHLTCCLNVP